MTEESGKPAATPAVASAAAAAPEPVLHIAPSPHLLAGPSTQTMMRDVLIGLLPVVAVALYVFHWYAVKQMLICAVTCVAAEAAFTALRRRTVSVDDLSAGVTGLILGLSLPWSAPWYAGFIASAVAIGIAKVLFGGLGQNIFNPAMVGRAFALIAFPAALGAAAYARAGEALDVVTRATPLTAAKQAGISTDLLALFAGTTNGSLGETSAAACLLGGLYLCWRRSASWEIPAGVLVTVAVLAGIGDLVSPDPAWTAGHHLLGGALLFGAFFIATDPVTSPLTPRGKWFYGAGIGAFVLLIREFSGYPEGVMFAVLLMNAAAPLINRWTIPRPVGGPVPVRK
ncbi:MAG: RnfABCDGE type electron transport complex subunit D [Gemmatimonadota bacterium]